MNYYDILFARKMAGGQGEITTEGLSVTENGTYTAPEGKAYTPVVVNVSGYKIKDIPNTPTAIATFNASALPMPSLKVSIEPIQEGSGDPSPENIRPISGWNEVDVTVADDVENPTVSNVYTIDLDGTRYGGEVDVVNGVMTVDKQIVDLGSVNWNYDSATATFNTFINGKTSGSNMVCSAYKVVYKIAQNLLNGEISGLSVNGYVNVKNTDYTDATAFKTAMNGVQLVYELATPQTIQLTPTAIKSLLGNNNIWADTGDVLEGSYFKEL